MVCYAVPAVCTIGVYLFGKHRKQNNMHLNWLTMMLLGGSIFGFVDHFWNGELFLIGPEPLYDLSLGVLISVAISVAWALTVFVLDKSSTPATTISK